MDKTEKYKMSREYLQECIAACDRGIAKLSRAKNYVKAQELMRKKKEKETEARVNGRIWLQIYD